MANIARLGVVLGLQTAEFTTGIEDAKRKTKDLGISLEQLKVGTLAVGAAIAAAATKVMAFADEIADTADAFQTSIGNVLDLSEALAQSGGNAENAGKMLGMFASKVDDAAKGGKEAQQLFTGIGVSLKDLSQLSMDDLFRKTLDIVSKIEDPIKRNAVAFDLFGKAVRGVDLTKLSDEMLEGVGATDKQIAAIRRMGDAMDALQNVLFKTKIIFAEVFSDALATAEINFKGFGSVVESVVNVIKKAFEGLVFGFGVVVESVKWAATAVSNVMRAMLPGGQSLAEMGAANNKQFLENIKALAAVGTEKDKPKETPQDLVKRKVTPWVDKGDLSKQNQLLKELAALEFVSIKYENMLKEQEKGIALQSEKLAMTQNEGQIAQVLYDLEKKRTDQIAQLEEKKRMAIETGADKKVIAALDEQIAKVNELTNAYKDQIVELTIDQQNLSQSYAGGWMESFQKYQQMAIDNAAVISQSVDALFNGMTLALTNFVRTGKLNFKDFATSIIADMMRIQIQAAASKLFSGVLGAIGGSLLSSFTNNALGPGFVGPVQPQADGGDVNAFQPYYVGENGPELIIPGKSGTVIPNNKLGMMGGGGTTNITNNYIDAIDTKSFEDRIYGSSRAVWSANQYASKNISNSRTRS